MRSARIACVGLMTLCGPALAGNPVLPGADPDVIVVGDTYWMYPTVAGEKRPVFKAYASKDLRTWIDRGVILNLDDVPWVKADGRARHGAWAPSVLAAKGKYFLYYAVGPQTADRPSRIGVAIGEKPDGPFVDRGTPLVVGGNGFEAIDPEAFTDPKSSITYLYAGGSAGSTLRMWELTDDFVGLKREIDVKTPPQFTEAAFMHERDGVYYLSYSHGRWNDASYSVHYATSTSPVGPWTYRGCILSSDATHKGPGHHAFVKSPGGEWYIVYHRYDTDQANAPFKVGRKIAVDRIDFAADGTIEPVRMTDGDVPAPGLPRDSSGKGPGAK